MNDLLATLSAAHFGAFTAHDAYDCGYQRQSLSQLVRRGRALRVAPSAYVDRARYEPATAERRHEMATRAVVRTFEGRVYASHYSALTLMSLPVFRVPLGQIHVARAKDTQTRRRPGLSIHTAYGLNAGRLIGRTPSVTPALAILGAAMTCGIETGVVAADAALAAGKTTLEDLQTWLDRLSRHREVTHARQVLRLADGRSESVGESRARLLLNAIGFRPLPQVEIRDRQGRLVGRVDFLLEREGIIVEFDGLMKYADANGREALAAEKAREDRMRALGYEFVRLTWGDLSRPVTVDRLMGQAMARASARRAS
jgi:very-short-patch-repair endonuclease